MKILSIQTGQLKNIWAREKNWSSGIYKTAAPSPIHLGTLGLEGDVQGNLDVHGGEARALYALSIQAYDFWRPKVPADFQWANGTFGENITMSSLDESKVHVGDIFTLGKTIVQATMPRFPCSIMASRLKVENGIDLMYQSEQCGILFSVLQTGVIAIGEELVLKKKSDIPLGIIDFLHRARKGTLTESDFNFFKTIEIFPKKLIERLRLNLPA